jgi:glycosyltransferase involved in cell wall biosynthesis
VHVASQGDSASPRKLRAVIVSPAMRYGSWLWFEDIMAHAPDVEWTVIAYGHAPVERLPSVKFITCPGFDYLLIGRVASYSWMLWLNFVYVFPLAIVAWCVVALRGADIVVGNGVATTVLLSPCALRRRTRLWLAFHVGWIGPSRSLARLLLSACDGGVTVSEESAREVSAVLRSRPVVSVPHWADEVYFSSDMGQRVKAAGLLKVLFVGRTDPGKFAQCKRVCVELAKQGLVELTVVGGRDDEPTDAGITWAGYVSSQKALAEYYANADVTWAPADVDYLSRPGIEALASGCPVVVSDISCVPPRDDGSVRIPRSLVPVGAGWVVDGGDDEEALGLLARLARTEGQVADPSFCRSFAREHHSPDNIRIAVAAWSGASSN